MNWSLGQTMNYEVVTPPEQATRSIHLNSFALCVLNHSHALSTMVPLQNSHWLLQNSPTSAPNVRHSNNRGPLLLSRRMIRSTKHENLLKSHVMIKNHHRDLDVGTHVAAWKDIATLLNGRVEHADVELDDRVFDTSNSNL